jgi:hypothetical protein
MRIARLICTEVNETQTSFFCILKVYIRASYQLVGIFFPFKAHNLCPLDGNEIHIKQHEVLGRYEHS